MVKRLNIKECMKMTLLFIGFILGVILGIITMVSVQATVGRISNDDEDSS